MSFFRRDDEASASVEAFEANELTDQSRIRCYALAGDKEKAIALLEASYRRHYPILPLILTEPVLEPWSTDPRLIEIRRTIGLEP